MANNKIEIRSKELEKQLNRAIKRNPEVTAKVVYDIAIDLAGRSVRIAPVKTGDLRNDCSATINNTTVFKEKTALNPPKTALKVNAEIGYSLPYAVRQHEELGYNHPQGGQAKYLETPFLQNEQKYIEKLQQIPKKVIK